MGRVTFLIRRGFLTPRFELPHGADAIVYGLGDSFTERWREVIARGVETVCLVDDAIAVSARDLRLLQRVLDATPRLDGITMDCAALTAIYGARPIARGRATVPWTTDPATTLPAWCALLRVARWPAESAAQTADFFLLEHAASRSLVRTVAPRLELDATGWAADLLLGAAPGLAADYARVRRASRSGQLPELQVPRQLQVVVPTGTVEGGATGAKAAAPTFSVLCPSIRPDYLRDAVESVAAQDWPHWELLVGVDGPKEHHLRKMQAILDDFAGDARVRVFHHSNMGTGPTRRKLAHAATGDYLMALDDDDRLPPHALSRFAGAIARQPHVAALRGGVRVFGLFETYLPPRARFVVAGISNDIFEVTQPWVVRRDVVERLGGLEFDPQMRYAGEDSDLFLKLDGQGLAVALLDEPLYERRLSTLNQTLDCTAQECLDHVRNLYQRHDPAPWRLERISFRGLGTLVGMVTEHRHAGDGGVVVCATRFMDFQKVGSRREVVLDLELSSLCNATCTFCPREHLQRSARYIGLDTVERVAHSLHREGGAPLVMLCGIAESTLHPELSRIVGMLARAGARVGLTTNGWSLTPDLVDTLTAQGLTRLNVSLNATTATTHAAVMRLQHFDRIEAAVADIATLRARRWPDLSLHLSFVVTEANASEAAPFVERWRHSGATQVWLHPLTNRTGLLAAECAEVDVRPLAVWYAGDPFVMVDLFPSQEGPPNLCRIARGIDFISVDGAMLLCAQDYAARHRFGDLTTQTLEEIHHDKVLRHLRGETADTCATCTFCPPSFQQGRAGFTAIAQSGSA